jgi:hypothetical protein
LKEFIADKKVLIFIFSCNYCCEVADGLNTTPTISEGKGRKSGGGLKPQVWAPVMSAAILVLLAMAGLTFYLIQKWCLHNSSLSFWYGGDDSSTFGQGLVANGQGSSTPRFHL